MERTYPKSEVLESKTAQIIGMIVGASLAIFIFYLAYTNVIIPQQQETLREQLGYLGLTPDDKVEGTNCYIGNGMNGLTGTCTDGTKPDYAFQIYAKTHPQAQRYLEMFK